MAADALHIWPRGNYMLIALPNDDGSFTATLFLAKRGDLSFERLTDDADIDRFLSQSFPDARGIDARLRCRIQGASRRLSGHGIGEPLAPPRA